MSALLLGIVFLLFAGPAAADGLAWLATQQQTDGSYGNTPTSLATSVQATAEVARAQQVLRVTDARLASALTYLAQYSEVDAEFLARRILVGAQAGVVGDLWVNQLIQQQNTNGGFGPKPGHDSTVTATAFALEALTATSYESAPVASKAVNFLLAAQAGNGSWTESSPNASAVFTTAQCLRALFPYRSSLVGVRLALTKGQDFLLSQRSPQFSWGEGFLSALALLALTPGLPDVSVISPDIALLQGRQATDGSWDEDAYTTALALQALSSYDARKSGSSSTSGSISGYVVLAGSSEPLGGAVITLSGVPGVTVTSNGDGYYLVAGLEPGSYTVSAMKDGYTAASVVAPVAAGQITMASTLVLGIVASTGVVRGAILDASTQQALSGVQVSLIGPASSSQLTSDAGTFEFVSVAPGSYDVRIEKAGYATGQGTVSVQAGGAVILQTGLVAAGAFVDSSPGTIRGRLVDGKTNAGVAAALVDIGAGLSVSSGADGTFLIAHVPRGSYQAKISASGYVGVTGSFLFSPGASGDIGTITLFPADAVDQPTTLTVVGLVADGITGLPIPGAAVALNETGEAAVANSAGAFTFSGLALKTFSLSSSAPGYVAATYTVQAVAFGEARVTLRLSPPATGSTTSTLSGTVNNSATGSPIPGAQVGVFGGAATTSSDTGAYTLSGIDAQQFDLRVSAVGFATRTLHPQLAGPGQYTLNVDLEPVTEGEFQVVSVAARPGTYGAGATALFDARVASLLDAPKATLLRGEVVDASGTAVATVIPYAPGTNEPTASFSFNPREVKDLVVPWNTARFPPGAYRLVLRAVEPSSINRAQPLGLILAENAGGVTVSATSAIAGTVDANPPLTQAGLPTPVALTALVQNAGNEPLAEGAYVLSILPANSDTPVYTAESVGPALSPGNSSQVSFGNWVPTTSGNLRVRVSSKTGSVSGAISGTLYVGDKASGTFTVDRQVVGEGTHTVRGHVAMGGVDVTQATSTDPLFALVKTAIQRGGVFTAAQALAWQQSNRCLGCHIQTQSLLGLSSALDSAQIDREKTNALFNAISSSQWSDGAIRISHPEFAKTQTTLGLWSLAGWKDINETFRTRYLASKFLFDRKLQSGALTYWSADHATGWWNTDVSHTALTIKGYADLLRDQSKIDPTKVLDYALGIGHPLGGGSGIEDITLAGDGTAYVVKSSGELTRIDPSTGTLTTVASGLPTPYGVALAADGSLYVCGGGTPSVLRLNTDGTRTSFGIGGLLTDIVQGADGWLYATDYNGQRILRMNSSGQAEVYASGGQINRPRSLVFDANGNLLVANHDGYNILKIAPDRAVTVFADQLAYQPMRLALGSDGYLYVAVAQPYNNGGLVKIHADGTAERLLQQDGILSVGAGNGAVFAADSNRNTLHQLAITPLAAPALSALRAELPRAVQYLLSSYQDNNSDNTVYALRLWGLAEVRAGGVLSDQTLIGQVNAAVAEEARVLRARQRADGGWGRYVNTASDPLVTAMVGIALEYLDPSAQETQIRSAIQYLLNTQLADGSWDNVNNGLTTRLASTSFVMVFMPKALERLGGIDVALNIDLPSSVLLGNPTIPPTTTIAGANDTQYVWNLQGVTGAGRNVDFDLTLADMLLNEQRPVARQTYLEFQNSFVNQKIQLPLAIPTVRATGQFALTVGTDKPAYGVNQAVAITSVVQNQGPAAAASEVIWAIRARGSLQVIEQLAPVAVDVLAPAAQVPVSAAWNTGTHLEGDYEVLASLYDARGRLVQEAVAPFQIAPPPFLAVTAVTTDKPMYKGWDLVTITGRVQNAALNALLPAGIAEITVLSPAGATLLDTSGNVNQLAPSALVDLGFRLSLQDAPSGTYPVQFVLKDAHTRAVVSTSSTSFVVQRQAVQSLRGQVAVDAAVVYQGVANRCTDSVTNAGSDELADVTILHRLVRVDTGATLDVTTEAPTTLPALANHPYVRAVDTRPLSVGAYVCVVAVNVGGTLQNLGFANFTVLEPPVKLQAFASLGGRGRLLILQDGPGVCDPSETDPFGPAKAPTLPAQRAAIESLLKGEQWGYTWTEASAKFASELRTGGYVSYALFSERQKLEKQVQQELREAVFRGEGLVVAGEHDARNSKLFDALGLKYIGRVSGVSSVVPAGTSGLFTGGFDLLANEKPVRLKRSTADLLATYLLRPGSNSWSGTEDGHELGDGESPEKVGSGKPNASDECGGHPERYLDAVTLNAYGRGYAACSGPDLAAITARDPANGQGSDALHTLLHTVQAADIKTTVQSVVPVQLTVANEGVAVPVTVSVTLPPQTAVVDPGSGTVNGKTLKFDIPSLAANQTQTLRFWLRLPQVVGTVTVKAVITAPPSFQTVASTGLSVSAPSALDSMPQKLESVALADAKDAKALRLARTSVTKAIQDRTNAQKVSDVLSATDALLGITDSRVVALRAQLGEWIRFASLPVAPGAP